MDEIMLGCAEVDITPGYPVRTIGFSREDQWSQGVESPLLAQAAVWKSTEEICCIVTIDHIGFSKAETQALREKAAASLGIEAEKVMICFSHTHAAPDETLERRYLGFVFQQVICCVERAAHRMESVNGAWGNASLDIGVNRRKGGTSVDRRGGILFVTAKSGEPLLVLLRLTAHANVLKQDNYLISPDYFGTVRRRLERDYRCQVMVTQGASGNIAPKYFQSRLTPPDATGEEFIRSDTALDDMAGEICEQIEKVIAYMTPHPIQRLIMYSRQVHLYSEVPEYMRALEIAKEAKRECGIDGQGWLEEIRRLREADVREQLDVTEVQYFLLGEGCLCGVANEVMCEFAMNLSQNLQWEYFYFGGYTNGCTGYFPTEEEFDKGGFEVYWSMLIYYAYYNRVCPLKRESARILTEFVMQHAPKPTE